MRTSLIICLTIAGLLYAQGKPGKYVFSGNYTVGDVLSQMCENTGCRLGLSGEVVELPITLSLNTNSPKRVFDAVNSALNASGYELLGTPASQISIRQLVERSTSFVNCRGEVIIVPEQYRSTYLKADSLACIDTASAPLTVSRFIFQYFGFTNELLENWGIDWTKILSSGDFFSKPSIPLSWAIRALGENDSLTQFRTLEFALDSTVNIVWGNESRELRRTYQESGTVVQDYENRNYGLSVKLMKTDKKINLDYEFISNDDNHQKLSGFGSAVLGDTLVVVGTYRDYETRLYFVPFVSHIPVIGDLFRYRENRAVVRFFVLRVIPL